MYSGDCKGVSLRSTLVLNRIKKETQIMSDKPMFNQPWFVASIATLMLLLLLVACGGGGSGDAESEADSSSPTTNRPAVATMPVPSFSSVGEQSAITSTMNTAEEAAPEADGPDLVLGERVYANHCAECHGANAEGGSAATLVGMALDPSAFENLLRTGGEIGPEHLFGPQKVSPGGLDGLYGFILAKE